jgi:hypothetical protein
LAICLTKKHASDDARTRSRAPATDTSRARGPQPGADDFCVAARSYSGTTERTSTKGEIMHAALVNLTIDPDQAPAAANALTDHILPAIRSARLRRGLLARACRWPWLFVRRVRDRGASTAISPAGRQLGRPRRQHQRCRLPASCCQRLEIDQNDRRSLLKQTRQQPSARNASCISAWRS